MTWAGVSGALLLCLVGGSIGAQVSQDRSVPALVKTLKSEGTGDEMCLVLLGATFDREKLP